jgi:hypothetical protein
MVRFTSILIASFALTSCAVVDMPSRESNLPVWIEDKLAADETERSAPVAIPETRLRPRMTNAMDQSALEIIERRDSLDAERDAADGLETTDIEEFVGTGVERTTPPE